eukprot:TRINITY_DN6809_c0_g1_i1.p1 TRINITY_DN6809_c0_g1~~TRINITY_DN6809_c0_g1_i1.p1  ORF type:complete len:2064 (+),score=697.75 TRINITY_DN6809_c0_g1_i1:71-6262(+)
MNVQGLVVGHKASLFQTATKTSEPQNESIEEKNSGSIRLPIDYVLLAAMTDLRKGSVDQIESLKERVQTLAEEYVERRKLKSERIPDFALEPFADVEFVEEEEKDIVVDWVGVVLKLHQATLDNATLFDLVQTMGNKKMKRQTFMKRTQSNKKLTDLEALAAASAVLDDQEEPEENSKDPSAIRLLKADDGFIAINPTNNPMKVRMQDQALPGKEISPAGSGTSLNNTPSFEGPSSLGKLRPTGSFSGSFTGYEENSTTSLSRQPLTHSASFGGDNPLSRGDNFTSPLGIITPSPLVPSGINIPGRGPPALVRQGSQGNFPTASPFTQGLTIPTKSADPMPSPSPKQQQFLGPSPVTRTVGFNNTAIPQMKAPSGPANITSGPTTSTPAVNISPSPSMSVPQQNFTEPKHNPGQVIFVDPAAERAARGNSGWNDQQQGQPDQPWDGNFSDEEDNEPLNASHPIGSLGAPASIPRRPSTTEVVPRVEALPQNLPPARLAESLSRTSTQMSQSAMYAKALPAVDAPPTASNVIASSLPSNPAPALGVLDTVADLATVSYQTAGRKEFSVIAPASYFTKTLEKSKEKEMMMSPPPERSSNEVEAVTFPFWLDFVLYWGDAVHFEAGLMIDFEVLLMTLNSVGYYDYVFGVSLSNVLDQMITRVVRQDKLESAEADILTGFQQTHQPPYSANYTIEYLRSEFDMFRDRRWTINRYDEFVQTILSLNTESTIESSLKEVEKDVLIHIRVNDQEGLRNLERFLIALLGNTREECREAAARLLNVIYDGHDWQASEALVPVIRTVDDTFAIEIDVGDVALDDYRTFCLVYMPSRLSNEYMLTRLVPVRTGTKLRLTTLPPFAKAGYYDWRFVTLNLEGNFVPLPRLELSQIQGRVIVQGKIRHEIIHEVWVDLQDSDWDRNRGFINKKGTFAGVSNALTEYKRQFGISTVYVMGALDRPPWGPPLSPIDKATPNRWLGGGKEFDDMVSNANNLGMKIVVDATAKVSSRLAHRKYKDLTCYTLNEDENLKVHPGTDGKDFLWNDCVLLNWRKKDTWDLTISEIKQWAARGVSGVRLDGAQSWPLILTPDSDELFRQDSDGAFHYTNAEIFEGEVVEGGRWDEGHKYGFHGTRAAKTHPNPFFIKMTRAIWKQYPQFFFLAEVFWSKEVSAISSGLIPYSAGLSRSMASIFKLGINKDGTITQLNQNTNVNVFYDWYEHRATYPQNSILLVASSSHNLPYPSAIYGKGAWSVVDLIYFLPEVPMTFIGEQFGWTQKPDIYRQQFVPLQAPRQYAEMSVIRGHYEHRSTLRRTFGVLREGGMMPLLAYHSWGWHDRVFAFCRFTKQEIPEIAIVAVNFNDVESQFYIDFAPLRSILRGGDEIIYRIQDLINPGAPPQYFTPKEFLGEKNFVVLPPFGSICWGVFVMTNTPGSERVLFEHSMKRLQHNLAHNLDPANNMMYTLLMKGFTTISEFELMVQALLKRNAGADPHKIPKLLQHVFTLLTQRGDVSDTRVLAFLQEVAENGKTETVKNVCRLTLEKNRLGSIVFITPEIGRFSTVGGVGVMVNELTQAMASLGCEVHIVSPYYNYNRKGKTGYLAAEGIEYTRNIVTYVGHEHVELGVHEGTEHGVHLVFLHNWKYFSTPYETGSPVHQLQQVVLMAKGSLEYCCQAELLPMLVVTNDWYTGLVAAYAKSGSFGTTFKGTILFHIVHNLEIGYEGKIYLDGNDDLSYIHQLNRDLIVDPTSRQMCLNSSRCALLCSDQWGTVSASYRDDLMKVSPLANLLCRYPQPFAKLNGIRLEERLDVLKQAAPDHETAKAMLQKKYFGEVDPSIPIFAFVGRIVLQKGVHLVLNAVRELMDFTRGRIQILIGGMANMKDPYAAQCAWSMQGFRKQYKARFWADPQEFFTDGTLVNIGADFALMPSLFEPSGVVQQEFFAGGTPVIAFKTGGLKDTIFEYYNKKGNGFTFEAHAHNDFLAAVKRALAVFNSKADYAQLRQNARDAVLDVTNQAKSWAREYARLADRFWSDPESIEAVRREIRGEVVQKEEKTEEKKEEKVVPPSEQKPVAPSEQKL